MLQRDSTRFAVASQLTAAAYLQAVEWIDLFPWNDLSKGNMQERLDVVLLLSQLFIALAYARHWLGWRPAPSPRTDDAPGIDPALVK